MASGSPVGQALAVSHRYNGSVLLACHGVPTHQESTFDVQLARQETAGCHRVIHLDNSGAALPPDCVTEAFIAALRQEAEVGSYRSARHQQPALRATYAQLAQLLNCHSSEIALVESGSRAWDSAFSMIQLAPGSLILATEYEYANNYITMLRAARRHGCQITFIRLDENGDIDLSHLMELIDTHGPLIRIIAITHVPTHNAIINPVDEIGNLIHVAKTSGALSDTTIYIVDACQSAGQMPIDVQAIRCDILTVCSRKFLRGPRGVAALYFRKQTLEREIFTHDAEPEFLNIPGFTWVHEHQYEMKHDSLCFESWESSYSAKVAFGRAVEYCAAQDAIQIQRYIGALAAHLRGILSTIKGLSLTDVGAKKSSLVTFSISSVPVDHLLHELEENNINISLVDQRTAHLNMHHKRQRFVLRSSVHYYNTRQEVEKFAQLVEQNVQRSR